MCHFPVASSMYKFKPQKIDCSSASKANWKSRQGVTVAASGGGDPFRECCSDKKFDMEAMLDSKDRTQGRLLQLEEARWCVRIMQDTPPHTPARPNQVWIRPLGELCARL